MDFSWWPFSIMLQQMIGAIQNTWGVVVANGLLNDLSAYYWFNNNVNDETGTHNWTATNLSYSTGVKKLDTHSWDFNWISSEVDLNADINLFEANTSFFTWVYFNSIGSWKFPHICWRYDSWTNRVRYLRANQNNESRLLNTYNTSNGWYYTINRRSIDTLSNNTRYHVWYTFDWATVKLYQDGVLLDSTTSLTGSIKNNAEEIKLWFRWDWFSDGYLNWYLDWTAIWGRTLTPTNITALYNSGAWLPYSLFTS